MDSQVQTQTNGNTPPTNTLQPSKALTLAQAVDDVRNGLEARRPDYVAALPAHIPPDRFQRTVITACNLNPELMRADRRSLLNAACKAAQDGLLPDGRDGALVIFNTKEKGDKGQDVWVKRVSWMPMIAGIIKKARQSGDISSLGARIVYAKEIEQGKFLHKVVDGIPKVDHEPILWGERGAPVLVYSFVQFKDGTTDFEFMHADDVQKVRNVSRSKDSGPWAQWPDEMWKKTVIRRHAKRLPVSSELFDTIARDDELTEFSKQRAEADRKMLTAAAHQMGAVSGDAGVIDHDPDYGTVNDNGEEPDAPADPLADMETELMALANCKTEAAISKMELEVGAALAGDFDALTAWAAKCSERRAEIKKR